jgi:hypothetical protein
MEGTVRSKVYLALTLERPEQFDVHRPQGTIRVQRIQIVANVHTGSITLAHCWGVWLNTGSHGDTHLPYDALPLEVRAYFAREFRAWVRKVFQSWASMTEPACEAAS